VLPKDESFEIPEQQSPRVLDNKFLVKFWAILIYEIWII